MHRPRTRLHGAILPLALTALAAPAAAQTSAPSSPVAVADTGRAAAPATEVVAVQAIAGEEGFGLRTADNRFVLRIKGGVQYDGRFFAGDEDDAIVNTFNVRRARSDIQGTLYRDYDFRVNLELAGTRVELLDAYVDARLTPAFRVRAGKMKGPVGLERLQTPFDIAFHDRALPTQLVPNRDEGLQLHGAFADHPLADQLGLFNGTTDGASEEIDTSDGKDVAARVFVQPFRRGGPAFLEGLGLGVAGTWGELDGSAAAPGLPTLRTAGRETFFRYRGDGTAAGTVVADGRRQRLSPQGYYYVGGLGLVGEYVSSATEVALGDASRELTNTAWQVTTSYVLTGESASYRGVQPRRPFNPRRGSWGAFEVKLRANGLEVDEDAFPLFADPARSVRGATAYAAGVNWYLNRFVRVLLDYERTGFDAAPGGGVERPTENLIVTRFQVAF